MPWNYIDVIIDNQAAFGGDHKIGPGDFASKEDAAEALRLHLNRLYQKHRGSFLAGDLKNLRKVWAKRDGHVTRSNNVVLAVYEHPKGQAEAYGVMLSMLVNRLCKVNRLSLLAGHPSFWAMGEILKKYPDIKAVCGKLEMSR